jgi:hypothetical protein
MERMGHSSTRAAMIYLHSSDERQRKIADALGELAQAELRGPSKSGKSRKVSGTHVARRSGLTWCFWLARLEGLEPPTGCLEGSCSIRLSYRRTVNDFAGPRSRTGNGAKTSRNRTWRHG